MDRKNIDRVQNSMRMDQMELALQGNQNRNCCNHRNRNHERDIEARRTVKLEERIVEAHWVENKMALHKMVAKVLGMMARMMVNKLVVMGHRKKVVNMQEDRKKEVNMQVVRTREDRKMVLMERNTMVPKVEDTTVLKVERTTEGMEENRTKEMVAHKMVVNMKVRSKPEVMVERKMVRSKSE